MNDSLQRRCGGSDIKRERGLEQVKNSVEASRAKLMVTMESVEQVLNTILLNIANHQHAQFVHHFPSCIISPQKKLRTSLPSLSFDWNTTHIALL